MLPSVARHDEIVIVTQSRQRRKINGDYREVLGGIKMPGRLFEDVLDI
jgi:hypothetical protein